MSSGSILAALAGAAASAGIVDLAAGRRDGGTPARLVATLARIGRRIGAPRASRDLAAKLAAAGEPLGLAPRDVAAIKAGSALVVPLAASPLAAALPGRLPLLALIALPVCGFLAPDWWLGRRARRRAAEMEVELPDLIDLLRVAVEAGMQTGRALAEVSRRHGGVLAAEWRAAANRLALGEPRVAVLERLVRRCPTPGMAILAAAIERAERHGAPLSATLAAQAQEARAARARQIRERAARAAPKIQLVIALLLVPSVLLMVAAALVASLAR